MMTILKNNKQHGAVSLFIVIFSALLVTIITVSFVGIMVKNQQQATSTDLSQSAYDSAQAGVEDAKRALLQYQSTCNSNHDDCDPAEQLINSSTCNTAVKTLTDIAAAEKDNEIKVQTGEGNSLDQAYTCVKINLWTNDYVGILTKEASKLVPLVGVNPFNTIKIDWFSSKDLQGTALTADVPKFNAGGTPLLSQNDWSSKIPNRPSIMRAQLIKFDRNGFKLSDFDHNSSSASNNTLFLYPLDKDQTKSFSSDTQRASKSLTKVRCESNLSLFNYACSATITLPETISSDSYVAYLNLTAIYKNTHYKVTLLNDSTMVQFDAVQPLIDSTGRANDLFRRVETRVELTDTDFPYPDAAVYTLGNLCKDFMITDSESDYSSAGCTQ